MTRARETPGRKGQRLRREAAQAELEYKDQLAKVERLYRFLELVKREIRMEGAALRHRAKAKLRATGAVEDYFKPRTVSPTNFAEAPCDASD